MHTTGPACRPRQPYAWYVSSDLQLEACNEPRPGDHRERGSQVAMEASSLHMLATVPCQTVTQRP
jgi:hypothetical protein